MKTKSLFLAAFCACRARRVKADADGYYDIDTDEHAAKGDARDYLNGAAVHAIHFAEALRVLLEQSEKAQQPRRRIQSELMRWELSGRPTSPTIH